jgi:hypothetical protein
MLVANLLPVLELRRSCEFSKIFEKIPIIFSGALGKVINEKNLK